MLTVGLDLIVPRTLTIVQQQLVSMEPLASIELGVSTVDVQLEKLDFFAIWTMRVLRIPATKVPSATPAQSTVPLRVPVLLVTKEWIVLRTSMNAIKGLLANIMVSA